MKVVLSPCHLSLTAQPIEFGLHEAGVAFRTDPVAELGLGMVADVPFDLLPVIAVVADLLAV